MAWTASSSPMVSAAAREIVGPVAHAHGQRLQDPDDLAPLLVLQLHDVVVEVDRGQRLHEHARPRARAAVHDPRDLAAVLGLQQQHVAVVARGDELVLQHAVGVLALQERLHHRGELRAQAHEGPPRLGELGRSVVRHLAARKDGAANRRPPPRSCRARATRGGRGGARPRGAPPGARSRPRPSMNDATSERASGSRCRPGTRAAGRIAVTSGRSW